MDINVDSAQTEEIINEVKSPSNTSVLHSNDGVSWQNNVEHIENISLRNNNNIYEQFLKIVPLPKEDAPNSKLETIIKIETVEEPTNNSNPPEQITFKCDDCGVSFLRRNALSAHNLRHCSKRQHRCLKCSESFLLAKDLDEHMTKHSEVGDSFKCEFCHKYFLSDTKFKKHKKQHEKIYACGACEKSFPRKSHLLRHESIHTEERLFICKHCEKKFKNNSSLASHLKSHFDLQPGICQQYQCPTCGKCFSTHKNRLVHEKIHNGERDHVCEYCKKCFTTKSNLVEHARIHTGDKPYVCQYCPRTFRAYSLARNHVATHTGEKKYKCEYCGRGFSANSSLKVHLTIHTGKPFACDWPACMKVFPTNSILNTHKKSHTAVKTVIAKRDLVKVALCDLCGKEFSNIRNYKKHMKLHDGSHRFECTKCIKVFLNGNHLKEHLRIHTGEKPYSCEFCERLFAMKSNLVTHTRIHTGERPFQCQTCGEAYRSSSSLRKHERNKHGTKPAYDCDSCGKSFTTLHCLSVHASSHVENII